MTERLPQGQAFDVLELMMRDPEQPRYGLEIVRMDPDKLGRTSIYMVLTRMVAFGFLSSRLETDEEQEQHNVRGPKRRLYQVTDFGKQQYRARVAADRAAEAVRVAVGATKPSGAM